LSSPFGCFRFEMQKANFFTTKYNECYLVIREFFKMHFYKRVLLQKYIVMIDSKQDAHPPNALDRLHLLHVAWERSQQKRLRIASTMPGISTNLRTHLLKVLALM
ncbi:hypothetical protein T10_7377, partial [Trichinella papuae]